MILQPRHTTFITESLKEIHSGHETGLIDTGPFARKKVVNSYQSDRGHISHTCEKIVNHTLSYIIMHLHIQREIHK